VTPRFTRPRPFALIALVAAISFGSTASAQKVVLGPAVADTGGEAVAGVAKSALADALRMQGLNVMVYEQGKVSAAEGCDDACGARLLHVASADLSAIVHVVNSPSSGHSRSRALVKMFDAAGHRYEGSAEIRDGDVRDAVTRAVLDVRAYQLLGPGPWLRIEGTPEGAAVLIDGENAGTLPYRAPIAPGKHDIVVRETGYARAHQAIDVPTDDSRHLDLRIALEPSQLASPSAAAQSVEGRGPEAPSETTTDSTWLAAPVAMGVLGVGLAAALTVRIASGVNDCVDPDMNMLCTEKRTVRAGPTIVGYTLSAALLGGAITWIALGLSHDSEPSEPPPLAAGVGLGQVSLRGSF
jgi:PEGA domain